jgi:hypothetical protein
MYRPLLLLALGPEACQLPLSAESDWVRVGDTTAPPAHPPTTPPARDCGVRGAHPLPFSATPLLRLAPLVLYVRLSLRSKRING